MRNRIVCLPPCSAHRPRVLPLAPDSRCPFLPSLALIALQVLAEELEHTSATLAAMEASHAQLGKTRDEYHGQVGGGQQRPGQWQPLGNSRLGAPFNGHSTLL